MKKVLKWVWGIIEVLIIIYAIAVTSLILCRNRFGYTQFDKTTLITVNEENLSNLGSVQKKDLLLVENTGANGIKEGDNIYYYATINNEYVIKMGTVASVTSDDTNAVYNLNDEDKTSISSTRVMGKYKASYASIGATLEFLQGRVGFLIFVLLPILLIFIYQIYDLVMSFKYAATDDDEKEEVKEKRVKEPKEEIKSINPQEVSSVPEQNEVVSNEAPQNSETATNTVVQPPLQSIEEEKKEEVEFL